MKSSTVTRLSPRPGSWYAVNRPRSIQRITVRKLTPQYFAISPVVRICFGCMARRLLCREMCLLVICFFEPRIYPSIQIGVVATDFPDSFLRQIRNETPTRSLDRTPLLCLSAACEAGAHAFQAHLSGSLHAGTSCDERRRILKGRVQPNRKLSGEVRLRFARERNLGHVTGLSNSIL